MAKAGDGKLRSDQRRTDVRLSRRITTAPASALEVRASKSGFTSGKAYLDAFVLGDASIEAKVRKDAIRALGGLGKMGSNLNQIARRLNSENTAVLDSEDMKVIAAALVAVEAIGAEIRDALK